MAALFLTGVLPSEFPKAAALALMALVEASALVSLRLLWSGRFRASAWVFLAVSWVTLHGLGAVSGGAFSPLQTLAFLLVVDAGWLLGRRAALLLAGASLAPTLGLAALDYLGRPLPVHLSIPPALSWLILAGGFLLTVGPLLSILKITERSVSQAQSRYEAVRERERRLRVVIETASDGIHVLDEQGNVVEVNEAFCRMLGYTREELLHRNLSDWEMRWTHEELPGSIEQLMKTPGVGETRHRRKDGQAIEVEISAAAAVLDGRPVLCASARDITARKQAEQELKRNRALLRAVIEGVADAIYAKDLSGRYILFNRAAAQFTGKDPAEVLGKDDTHLFSAADAAVVKEQDRRVIESGELQTYETELRNAAGETVILKMTKGPLFDDSGTLVGVFGLSHDATADKRAEARLRESEAELRAAQRIAQVGSWQWDARTNRSLWSEETSRIFGLPPAPLANPGKLLLGRMHPEDQERVARALAETLEGGEDHDLECRIVRPDGSERVVHLQAEVVREETGEAAGLRGTVHDITARKEAEKALRASEERYRLTFENIPDGVVVYEADGAVSLMNAEARRLPREVLDRIAGWKPAGGEPRPVREDGSPFAPEELPVRRCVSTGQPQPETVLGIPRPDGSTLWAVCSTTPVLDAATGKLMHVVLAYRDVTQQREAEKALSRANQQIRLLANNLDETVFTCDLEGRLLYANPAVEALTGCTLEELQREPALIRVSRQDRERAAAYWEELRGGRSFSSIEFEITPREGQPKWVEASVGPLLDDAGRQVGVQGVARDVTDRRRTEAALRESNEKFARTFRAAPVLISISEVANGTFLDVNDFALEVTGFSREEVIGHTSTEIGLLSEQDRSLMIAELKDQGRISGLEVILTCKGGREMSGVVYGDRMVVDGRDCLLLVVVDITDRRQAEAERRRLEEQLQQAQKLESVGRLAGGVAHDFNNLLTVINGYSELLLALPAPSEVFSDYMGEIRRAGGRAAELTRQLLAFSRKQIVEPRPVSWNDLLRESQTMLRRMVGEDIEIETELCPETGQVMADPGQLHQVLMNLVVNARDAMPLGGRLRLWSRKVELDAAAVESLPGATPGPYLVLEVSDTGVGMTEEVLLKAFEPFFTTKAPGMGTGLGLSTVYGIVRQAGGWVGVKSRPGEGTMFRIGLPALEKTAVRGAPEATPAGGLEGSETILVVEDQDEVRRLALEILGSYRYQTLEASSGEEAVAIAQRHTGPIHLALTDVVMPQMTGKQLADRLCEDRPELKVLYMSGYTADVISRQGVLDSGIDYIQKPFTPEGLVRKIRSVLGAA